jgi:sugar phosphate isomerase/epimerase
MAGLTRREFIDKAGRGAAAAGVMMATGAKLRANPLGLPLGSQTYPERQQIADGKFVELLKNMKTAGIEQIELCSAAGYAQFKSLADGKQTRKIIEDNGLKCISAHFGLNEFKTPGNGPGSLTAAIQWAQDIGMTQIGTASLGSGGVNGVQSTNQVRYAAEEYNRIGATVKAAGLQLFLHNEALENSRLEDGRLTYPVLLDMLDPELVKMQFQMSSMRTIGSPIQYFRNHPGRFISAHVHGVNLADGPVAARGMVLPVKQAAPPPGAAPAGAAGQGRGAAGAPGGGRGPGVPGIAMGEDSVDWPTVFAAAKVGGLKNFFIEQEQSNGWDCMVKGAAYLKTLS